MSDWTDYSRERLDREYGPGAVGPAELERYGRDFTDRSEALRGEYPHERDVAYGDHPRERLDLFAAPVPGAPIAMMVHGGWWRRRSKDEAAFVLAPFLRAGCAAAAINYPLAPEATLDEIVRSVRRAALWLHTNAARANAAAELVALGHSAGGHLVAMLAATDWHAHGIAPPLRGIAPISGLYDLEPVRRSYVDEWLRLDDAAVLRNSPQHHLVQGNVPVVAGVGTAESAEFRRQTEDYVLALTAAGKTAHAYEAAERDHFSVLYDLADETSTLGAGVLGLLA